jgi:hypothetical protein
MMKDLSGRLHCVCCESDGILTYSNNYLMPLFLFRFLTSCLSLSLSLDVYVDPRRSSSNSSKPLSTPTPSSTPLIRPQAQRSVSDERLSLIKEAQEEEDRREASELKAVARASGDIAASPVNNNAIRSRSTTPLIHTASLASSYGTTSAAPTPMNGNNNDYDDIGERDDPLYDAEYDPVQLRAAAVAINDNSSPSRTQLFYSSTTNSLVLAPGSTPIPYNGSKASAPKKRRTAPTPASTPALVPRGMSLS